MSSTRSQGDRFDRISARLAEKSTRARVRGALPAQRVCPQLGSLGRRPPSGAEALPCALLRSTVPSGQYETSRTKSGKARRRVRLRWSPSRMPARS